MEKRQPISYGIICTLLSEPVKFLVVRKRHSYANITFLCTFAKNCSRRKPSSPRDNPYCENFDSIVYKLFTMMLKSEKKDLFKLAYDLSREENSDRRKIIYTSYVRQRGPKQRQSTIEATIDILLYIFKNGITLNGKKISMEKLCKKEPHSEPVWEFPKGHAHKDEPPLDCAMREFYEETKIEKNRFKIIFHSSSTSNDYVERMIGTDGNIYTYKYFTAIFCSIFHNEMNREYGIDNVEVSEMAWKTYEELHELWKKNYQDRLYIIEKVHSKIPR